MKNLFTFLCIIAFSNAFSQCNVSIQYSSNGNGNVSLIAIPFNVDSLNGYPLNFIWNFGDGTTDTAQYVSHQFNPMLSYAYVCVTMSTADNCTSTGCDSIIFSNPPTCQASYYSLTDSVNNTGTTISFYDYSVADSGATVTAWLWSFGDSTSSNLQNPIHTYSPGTYTVCLNIGTSSNCSSYYCTTITVTNNQQICHAAYYYNNDSLNVPSLTYTFFDQSNPDGTNQIVNWLWTVSDSSNNLIDTMMGQYLTYIFQQNGVYHVCLTITTSSGCTSTTCQNIYVNNNSCQLSVYFVNQNPTTIGGSDGYIESTVVGGTAPYSYLWNIGVATPNIYNLSSGYYALTTTDANGCQYILSTYLYDPNDTTGNIVVDTLFTNFVDTCLNFVPDTFYVSSITMLDSNTVSVTWVFAGSGQTVTITASYVFYQYGNTLVVLSLNCGTKAVTTYQAYINIPYMTYIDKNNNEQKFNVYPVPFQNTINLNVEFIQSKTLNISLIDLTGKVMLSRNYNSITNSKNIELNTTSIPSGMYVIMIKSNEGVFCKQIIK